MFGFGQEQAVLDAGLRWVPGSVEVAAIWVVWFERAQAFCVGFGGTLGSVEGVFDLGLLGLVGRRHFCVWCVLSFCARSMLPFCVDPVDVYSERRSKVKLLTLQGQSRAMCIVHYFGFGKNGIVSPW